MRGVLFLANYTGWSLAEIEAMETREFADWILHIPTAKK